MKQKRKLILITYDMLNAMHYRQELLDFFGECIEIDIHTVVDGIDYDLNADAVLTLSPMNNDEVQAHFGEEVIIIHGMKCITNDGYRKLMNIIPGSKVLLMTTNRTSSFEMAAYLYQFGINHVDFIPTYPDNLEHYEVDTAVTPGQTRFIPKYINHVIDIGWRRISPDTLMSIMAALNMKNEELLQKLYEISKDILSNDFSNTSLDLFSNTRELLFMTINLIDDGLLFLSTNYKPMFVNNAFLEMLRFKEKTFDMSEIVRYLPTELIELVMDNKEQDNYIFYLEERNKMFAFSKHFFSFYKEKKGCIIVLKDAEKIETLENEIRRKSIHRNTSTKYEFSDIIGESDVMIDCIRKAKRMALTSIPVLITGESGTGKELLAQSIHQYSGRRDKPFIALNCASLSEELLESELFGYEEGAFTGAKRGGKKGLFQLAQGGTLFLDEIGEIPFILQSKLLRVLQENEIRKIGGYSTIPIDVRIIAATNRNLSEMLEQGVFRLDLFYRLSMFSLTIPPLNERPEDILILAEHFLSGTEGNQYMSDELKQILVSYPWKGNIRELKNCIEYMAYMGSEKLMPKDLPPGYDKKLQIKSDTKVSEVKDYILNSLFPDLFQRQQKLCIAVLELLSECSMGRNRILYKLGYEFTEHEIKKCLIYLNDKEYLSASRGRGGTSISKKGTEILNYYVDKRAVSDKF